MTTFEKWVYAILVSLGMVFVGFGARDELHAGSPISWSQKQMKKWQPAAQRWAKAQPKKSLGRVVIASYSQPDQVTTLSLEDGTRVRVFGAFSFLRPDIELTTPVARYADTQTLYCLGEQCRFEAPAFSEGD